MSKRSKALSLLAGTGLVVAAGCASSATSDGAAKDFAVRARAAGGDEPAAEDKTLPGRAGRQANSYAVVEDEDETPAAAAEAKSVMPGEAPGEKARLKEAAKAARRNAENGPLDKIVNGMKDTTTGQGQGFLLQRSETSTLPAHLGYSSVRTRDFKDDTKTATEEKVDRKYTAELYARYVWRTEGQPLSSIWTALPEIVSHFTDAVGTDSSRKDDTIVGIAVKWNATGSRKEVSDARKVSWVYETETEPDDTSGKGQSKAMKDGRSASAAEVANRTVDLRDEAPPPFKYNYGPDFEQDNAGSRAVGGHFYWNKYFYKELNIGPRGPGVGDGALKGFHWQPTLGVEFGNLADSSARPDLEDVDGLKKYAFPHDKEIDDGTYLRAVVAVDASYRIGRYVELTAAGEFRHLYSIDTGDRNRWYAALGVRVLFDAATAKTREKFLGRPSAALGLDADDRAAIADTHHTRLEKDRPDPSFSVTFGHRVGELPPTFGRFEITEVSFDILF